MLELLKLMLVLVLILLWFLLLKLLVVSSLLLDAVESLVLKLLSRLVWFKWELLDLLLCLLNMFLVRLHAWSLCIHHLTRLLALIHEINGLMLHLFHLLLLIIICVTELWYDRHRFRNHICSSDTLKVFALWIYDVFVLIIFIEFLLLALNFLYLLILARIILITNLFLDFLLIHILYLTLVIYLLMEFVDVHFVFGLSHHVSLTQISSSSHTLMVEIQLFRLIALRMFEFGRDLQPWCFENAIRQLFVIEPNLLHLRKVMLLESL